MTETDVLLAPIKGAEHREAGGVQLDIVSRRKLPGEARGLSRRLSLVERT